MNTRSTAALGSVAALLLVSSASSVFAQSEVPAGLNSPQYSLTDPNGINLLSNKPSAQIDAVKIGGAERLLSSTITSYFTAGSHPAASFTDTYDGKLFSSSDWTHSAECQAVSANSYRDVFLGGSTDRMCGTLGGSYIPQRGTGSFMVTNPNGSMTYTKKDGTQYLFGPTPLGFLTQIAAPDGLVTTLTYKSVVSTSGVTMYRRQSVNRSDGLQFRYGYESNSAPTHGGSPWFNLTSVRAINNAVEYCDPAADTCTLTQDWPVATLVRTTVGSTRYLTVTDAGGRATRFTIGIPVLSGGVYGPHGITQFFTDQILAVRSPTSTSQDTVAYTYCAPTGEYYCMKGGVRSVNTDSGTWTYSGTSGTGGPSVIIQLTSARPGGGSRVTTQQLGNSWQGPMMSYSDNLTLRTFQFDSSIPNRLQHVVMADGHRLTYVYDSRGNITQETHTPKTGSPLTPAIKTANYDATCTNPVKCNKPNWVKDAKDYQTDFEYDPVHGGVLKITSPPSAAGIRPQLRQTFAQRYAWYKNASGTVVQAPSPIWVLTTKKLCRTTAALPDGSGCSTASDEVTTAYEYGPTSGANNLLLRGIAVTADGVTLRTCYGYDIYGNRVSETLPKAGLTSCP